MERHGWRLRHSSEVSGTPEMYRSYIQHSRGELSCVKPSCVKLQNGWVSDRSLCYLASGKPVVMQDTGPSSYLPFGEGILQFSSPAEAAAALATVNADYERHCRNAREIAETYFDARQTAERILNVALA
jgi:glycosyltransferase involved in cell wall biosynthesis